MKPSRLQYGRQDERGTDPQSASVRSKPSTVRAEKRVGRIVAGLCRGSFQAPSSDYPAVT